MKLALRIVIVLAALLASLSPASYGTFFGANILLCYLLVVACFVLACSEFRDFHFLVRIIAWLIVMAFALAGFGYHFRDSGESGPLPYEWINDYFWFAIPLLMTTMLSIIFDAMKVGRHSEISYAKQGLPVKSDCSDGVS